MGSLESLTHIRCKSTSTSVSSSRKLSSSKSDFNEGWTRKRGITKILIWLRARLKRWVLMKIISAVLKGTSICAPKIQVSPFKGSRVRNYDKILTSRWSSAHRNNQTKIFQTYSASLLNNQWIQFARSSCTMCSPLSTLMHPTSKILLRGKSWHAPFGFNLRRSPSIYIELVRTLLFSRTTCLPTLTMLRTRHIIQFL